jgi:hypothetical protein
MRSWICTRLSIGCEDSSLFASILSVGLSSAGFDEIPLFPSSLGIRLTPSLVPRRRGPVAKGTALLVSTAEPETRARLASASIDGSRNVTPTGFLVEIAVKLLANRSFVFLCGESVVLRSMNARIP